LVEFESATRRSGGPFADKNHARSGGLLETGGDVDSVATSYFEPMSTLSEWSPTADHYPRLKMHGGHLTPDNVRLAHRLCNQRDYIWRKKINALLGKRMSLEEIAEKLNLEKVPTIHGTNRWTAASVRKAFVS
jgi:hypothetical protein